MIPIDLFSLVSSFCNSFSGNSPIFLLISSSGMVIIKSNLTNDLFSKPLDCIGSTISSRSITSVGIWDVIAARITSLYLLSALSSEITRAGRPFWTSLPFLRIKGNLTTTISPLFIAHTDPQIHYAKFCQGLFVAVTTRLEHYCPSPFF